jgi:hypothetical protein
MLGRESINSLQPLRKAEYALTLLAIVWTASTYEQIGEKLISFQSSDKILISKDNYYILFGLFPPMNKLVKRLFKLKKYNFSIQPLRLTPEKELLSCKVYY